MKLSDLPLDVLKAILNGPSSFTILELYKCGDRLLIEKLLNGGVTEVELKALSTNLAPKWPGVLKKLKLHSLSVIAAHPLGSPSWIRSDIRQLHRGIRKLIVATETAGSVFFDEIDESDPLPPSQAALAHNANASAKSDVWNLGSTFPELEELSINDLGEEDSFEVSTRSIELLPASLTYLGLKSSNTAIYPFIPRGLKHLINYSGPALSLASLLSLPPSIETLAVPMSGEVYEFLLTSEAQATFPHLQLSDSHLSIHNAHFRLGLPFITQLMLREKKAKLEGCSWALVQSLFPLPPLTSLELHILFASDLSQDASNVLTVNLRSHPLPPSLTRLLLPALDWVEIHRHFHQRSINMTPSDLTGRGHITTSNKAPGVARNWASLWPSRLTFLELFCDNLFTAEHFHLLPRTLTDLQVGTAGTFDAQDDEDEADPDEGYGTHDQHNYEDGGDGDDSDEGDDLDSRQYPLVETSVLASLAMDLLACHPVDASTWTSIKAKSGYGVDSCVRGPFSKENLNAIETGLHLGLPLSLTRIKFAPLHKAASFTIPPNVTTIDFAEQVFASPELLLRTLPPTDGVAVDGGAERPLDENLVTLFLINADFPIAPTIYKHLPRTLQYFGTSERKPTDAKYLKELPPQLRAFTFNGAPITASGDDNWTANLPRTLTLLSLPRTVIDASAVKGLPRTLERMQVFAFSRLRTSHIASDLPPKIRSITANLVTTQDLRTLQRFGAKDVLQDFMAFVGGGILSWDLFLFIRPFMPKDRPLPLGELEALIRRLTPEMSFCQRNAIHPALTE